MSQNLTGYPNIDKQWLKYYSEDAVKAEVPAGNMYEYLYDCNKQNTACYAINYLGRKITFGEMFTYIERLTYAYNELGIKAGDIIIMFALNVPEIIYSIYALNRLGAVIDMEYLNIKSDKLREAISHTGANVIITVDVLLPVVKAAVDNHTGSGVAKVVTIPISQSLPAVKRVFYNLKNRTYMPKTGIYMDYGRIVKNSGKKLNNKLRKGIGGGKDSVAVILHTGGTTGIPKGVEITNGNINSIATQYRYSHIRFHTGDTMMNIAPPFHAFGISLGIHIPLCLGVCICLSPDMNPDNTGRLYAYYRPSHMLQGPSWLKNIMENKKIQKMQLSFAYTVACGGESMSPDLEDKVTGFFHDRGANINISTGYGMTECCGTVTTNQGNVYKKGSVGIPLPLSEVMVIDADTGEEMRTNQTGELLLSSPGIMRGYYSDETETGKVLIEKDGKRWLRSGDLGLVDEDGFVFLRGRIKRIYITRSSNGEVFKLFPDYIESVMAEMKGIKACAVIAMEMTEGFYRAAAYVELEEHMELTMDMIIEHCRQRLPEEAVPAKIELIDKIPLSPVGKVDYKRLEKMVNNKQV